MSAETETENPVILVASAAYQGTDGRITLSLETKDRMRATFQLDALATATLMLTLGPAAKLALADLEKIHPRPESPTSPDSPEGLEG